MLAERERGQPSSPVCVFRSPSDDERFRIQMNMKSAEDESVLNGMAADGGSIFINFHICILLYYVYLHGLEIVYFFRSSLFSPRHLKKYFLCAIAPLPSLSLSFFYSLANRYDDMEISTEDTHMCSRCRCSKKWHILGHSLRIYNSNSRFCLASSVTSQMNF